MKSVSLIFISLISLSFITPSNISISIDNNGLVSIDNYTIRNKINKPILDAIINEPNRIKQKKKKMPNLLIYDKIGIRASSKPAIYNEKTDIRSIGIFYTRPFSSAPKLSYSGSFNIMDLKINKDTAHEQIFNNDKLKPFRIYYESISDTDLKKHLGEGYLNTSIEFLIGKTYIKFSFDHKNAKLISVQVDPMKKLLK